MAEVTPLNEATATSINDFIGITTFNMQIVHNASAERLMRTPYDRKAGYHTPNSTHFSCICLK